MYIYIQVAVGGAALLGGDPHARRPCPHRGVRRPVVQGPRPGAKAIYIYIYYNI